MSQQFNNTNELVEYLGTMEERIKTLEAENGKLPAVPANKENVDGNVIAKYISRHMPQTNLINPVFFKRAFTVWGHFMVANFIIGIGVGTAYLCLMMVMFGSFFGDIIQSQK